MANTNNISKQAILDYINERIEVRSKGEYTSNDYRIANQSSIDVFDTIRTLINQGVFDSNKFNKFSNKINK